MRSTRTKNLAESVSGASNTKASSANADPANKNEVGESEDDIDMSNEEALPRFDQDVSLPKSK
jgi:hypothetical protein